TRLGGGRRRPQELDAQDTFGTRSQPTEPIKGSPVKDRSARGRIPSWAWWVGGGVSLALIGFILFYVLLNSPGFTVIVRGAPPGSDVYVDNIRLGITRVDGTVSLRGLRSGKRLLRVSHDGYQDFNTSVTGKDGDVKPVPADLKPTDTKIPVA